MYLFLISFILVYGCMHLYAYMRLSSTFNTSPNLSRLLLFGMTCMTFLPLLIRVAESFQLSKAALYIAWPAYLWMGFIFIFVSHLIFFDALHYSCRFALPHIFRSLPSKAFSRNICKIVLLLAATASIYAFYEAGQIRSEHVVIPSTKLPSSASRIRIVQVSDIHIGLLTQKKRLERILEKITAARPDILVSTGDLIDGKLNRDRSISDHTSSAALLDAIKAPLGKFAVLGNHEVYAGLPQALDFTQAAGFTILRNQAVALPCGVTIAGTDDPAINRKGLADPATEIALLKSIPQNVFLLLLKHRPDIVPESDGRFDLQLSGHVHGGQIFPFNLLVKLKHPIPCGITTTKMGSSIYVSRGTGTWGPPMRLFAPPEITIIDIVPRQPMK